MNKILFCFLVFFLAVVVGCIFGAVYEVGVSDGKNLSKYSNPNDCSNPSIKALEYELKTCFNKVDRYMEFEQKDRADIIENLAYCDMKYKEVRRGLRSCVEDLTKKQIKRP